MLCHISREQSQAWIAIPHSRWKLSFPLLDLLVLLTHYIITCLFCSASLSCPYFSTFIWEIRSINAFRKIHFFFFSSAISQDGLRGQYSNVLSNLRTAYLEQCFLNLESSCESPGILSKYKLQFSSLRLVCGAFTSS